MLQHLLIDLGILAIICRVFLHFFLRSILLFVLSFPLLMEVYQPGGQVGLLSLKVLDAVFLGSLLRRDAKDATLEFLLRLQAWRSCTSHYFLVILCVYSTCWIKEA